jgi:hypothetical protein
MSIVRRTIVALSFVAIGYAAQDVVTAVHGTIDKIDSGGRIIVVKTEDGLHHSFRVAGRMAVHGADAVSHATADSFHGLKEGGEVVVHYARRGTTDTAVEIDKVGDDGLKTSEGAVKEIDRGGKRLVVDTGDGTEETFHLTAHASEDAGKDIGEGAIKGSKVTVYYTEEAGKKVAHFFKAS